MLIATIAVLTLLVFGGGGFQGFLPNNFNDQVKKQVTDSARKEQVLELTKQMEKEVEAFIKKYKAGSEDMMELNKKYDATEEELQQILDPIFSERHKTQKYIIEARLKMKELITREEWEAAFSGDEKQKK